MMKYLLFVLTSLLLTGCNKEPELPFTFWEEPFISPQIIKEMEGWISDTGDQIVTINLTESQNSNRYNADFEITQRPSEFPVVEFCYAEGCTFSYQYIGKTEDGVHILDISDYGGGSWVKSFFMLVVFEKDRALQYDRDSQTMLAGPERLLLKRVGDIYVGNRYKEYAAHAELINNRLHVEVRYSFDPKYKRLLNIEIQRPPK